MYGDTIYILNNSIKIIWDSFKQKKMGNISGYKLLYILRWKKFKRHSENLSDIFFRKETKRQHCTMLLALLLMPCHVKRCISSIPCCCFSTPGPSEMYLYLVIGLYCECEHHPLVNNIHCSSVQQLYRRLIFEYSCRDSSCWLPECGRPPHEVTTFLLPGWKSLFSAFTSVNELSLWPLSMCSTE